MVDVRRKLRTLVLLLMGGVGCTVVTTWCLSHFVAEGSYGRPVSRGGLATPSGEWLDFTVYHRPGCARATWSAGVLHPALAASREARSRPAPAWSGVPEHRAFQEPAPRATHGRWVETAVGWPCLALRATRTSRSPRDWSEPRLAYAAVGLTDLPPPRRNGRAWELAQVFPVVPVWPGFLVNALLASLALWLVVCGPRWLRRHCRARANRCPVCGYPVGASPRCSECGRPVAVRPVA